MPWGIPRLVFFPQPFKPVPEPLYPVRKAVDIGKFEMGIAMWCE